MSGFLQKYPVKTIQHRKGPDWNLSTRRTKLAYYIDEEIRRVELSIQRHDPRVLNWSWIDSSYDHLLCEIVYDTTPLTFDGSNAIRFNTVKEVLAFLQDAKAAAEAGAFDEQIARAISILHWTLLEGEGSEWGWGDNRTTIDSRWEEKELVEVKKTYRHGILEESTRKVIRTSDTIQSFQWVERTQTTMAFLQKYKFVVAERPLKVSGKSPILKRQDKMIVRLEEQIAVARAEMAGKPHGITVKNTKGAVVQKNIKHWYWLEPNGSVACELSFGPKVFKVGKSNANAFQVANMKELIEALEEAKTATKAGEFDTLIETAATRVPKLKP